MDPTIAVITMFAGNFAPNGWALCQGQLLNISQNTALFSLLGTTFGGNGQTTFGLPDYRGRMPVGAGGSVTLGQIAGAPTKTLTVNEMPSHTHNITASGIPASDAPSSLASPNGNIYAAQNSPTFVPATSANGQLGGVSATVSPAGGSQPFSIMMPYIAINYIIALTGIYPYRN
jgi:microcystin-dependent protein